MPGQVQIFISYRRGETTIHAAWIAHILGEHFGKKNVFRDSASIEPGVNFIEAIQNAVATCDVLVAVIGRDWNIEANESRRTRQCLDDPRDYVRLEIAAAVERNIRVVPALVQNVTLPTTDTLPKELGDLTFRNAIELRDNALDEDVGRLIASLEDEVDLVESTTSPGIILTRRRNRGFWNDRSQALIEVRLDGAWVGWLPGEMAIQLGHDEGVACQAAPGGHYIEVHCNGKQSSIGFTLPSNHLVCVTSGWKVTMFSSDKLLVELEYITSISNTKLIK